MVDFVVTLAVIGLVLHGWPSLSGRSRFVFSRPFSRRDDGVWVKFPFRSGAVRSRARRQGHEARSESWSHHCLQGAGMICCPSHMPACRYRSVGRSMSWMSTLTSVRTQPVATWGENEVPTNVRDIRQCRSRKILRAARRLRYRYRVLLVTGPYSAAQAEDADRLAFA
jgi:hypothetical protein